MTRIWLLYERLNVQRNQFFIDRWLDAGRERGVKVELIYLEEITYGFHQGVPCVSHQARLPLPDAAVMRMNHPLLSAHLELMGIPVFNSASVSRICNDKRLTHQAVSGLVPMMDTVFLRGDEQDSPFPYPTVVKSAQGCGGRQVYLAADRQGFLSAMERIRPDGALAQPLCDTPGMDVRVYILNGGIRQAMLRRSSGDFRSNIGQGGSAVPYVPDRDTVRMVEAIASRFDFTLVGVDFIFHQGRLLFNEIEDAVGTRMLYGLGIDIVREYLDAILLRLDGKASPRLRPGQSRGCTDDPHGAPSSPYSLTRPEPEGKLGQAYTGTSLHAQADSRPAAHPDPQKERSGKPSI